MCVGADGGRLGEDDGTVLTADIQTIDAAAATGTDQLVDTRQWTLLRPHLRCFLVT